MKKTLCLPLLFAIALSSLPAIALATEFQSSTLRTVWEDPFTLTSFHQNNEVNSTFYTFPMVIWNGSQYVDYIFNSSDMSAGVGSVYLRVCSNHTVFYDPYQQEERIQNESWVAEFYNTSNLSWTNDPQTSYTVYSQINSSGIYFDRRSTLISGGTLDVWYWLRIGGKLTISVVLLPSLRGEYRLVWLLNGISGTRVQWATATENVTTRIVNDKSYSQIRYLSENESKCIVDWSDARLVNQTSQKWEPLFEELQLKKDSSGDRCQARVSFGDFICAAQESVVLDPTIQTFNSTGGADGSIEHHGIYYPPTDGVVSTNESGLPVGQQLSHLQGNMYYCDRSYVSFNTSAVPALAYNVTAILRLKTQANDSVQDFLVQVWGGNQPIYGDNLTLVCWGTGSIKMSTWDTRGYQNDGAYINFTITGDQINKCGNTQFEINSSRDGINPPTLPQDELVFFYSGDSNGNEPKLEVSYCLDTVTLGTETWSYRNVSTTKAAIFLFGGSGDGIFSETATVNDIDRISPDVLREKYPEKLVFLDTIIQNGYSTFTPKNNITSDYVSNSTWVADMATWLRDHSYLKVCLFGFSAGGVIVGAEIQKNQGTLYSSAVIYAGRLNYDAPTASKTKVPTSFIFGLNDGIISYDNMKPYYDNANVDKEWHNCSGDHGAFFDPNVKCINHTCQYPSGENCSVAVLNWFNAYHPPSAPINPAGPDVGFAHNTFNYTSRGFQSDGGNLTYQFDWNDSTTTTVGPYASGTNVTCSHCWTAVPGGHYDANYNLTARVRDAYQNWSTNSTLLVHIQLDDDGCGGDAGDTFDNATTYNSGCSLGTLQIYPYLEQEDWYKFYAYTDTTITMDETPLDPFGVSLGLYNPSGTLVAYSYNGVGQSQNISYTANADGWWRAEICVYCDTGHLYTFHIAGTSGGGGGGCPYVYDWNGSNYVKDNNILPASETSNGTDTKDCYKLEQPLVPLFSTQQASLYTLQIREFENEHDYIDQVKLAAVDHSQNTRVAVTPEGEIVTYQNPASPLSCLDNNGNNQLYKIKTIDGNISDPATYFQGSQGDALVLDFGSVASSTANLILRDDYKCMDVCIDVQIPSGNGGWRTIEVLHPRDFWAIEAVNMSAYLPVNGNLLVRLFWTSTHRLDYVGLDTSPQGQMTTTSASPTLAIHSTMGDVTGKLLFDDENCAELVNGQQITMVFILPNKVQGTTRDFVLYTDGYYYTVTQ